MGTPLVHFCWMWIYWEIPAWTAAPTASVWNWLMAKVAKSLLRGLSACSVPQAVIEGSTLPHKVRRSTLFTSRKKEPLWPGPFKWKHFGIWKPTLSVSNPGFTCRQSVFHSYICMCLLIYCLFQWTPFWKLKQIIVSEPFNHFLSKIMSWKVLSWGSASDYTGKWFS